MFKGDTLCGGVAGRGGMYENKQTKTTTTTTKEIKFREKMFKTREIVQHSQIAGSVCGGLSGQHCLESASATALLVPLMYTMLT